MFRGNPESDRYREEHSNIEKKEEYVKYMLNVYTNGFFRRFRHDIMMPNGGFLSLPDFS